MDFTTCIQLMNLSIFLFFYFLRFGSPPYYFCMWWAGWFSGCCQAETQILSSSAFSDCPSASSVLLSDLITVWLWHCHTGRSKNFWLHTPLPPSFVIPAYHLSVNVITIVYMITILQLFFFFNCTYGCFVSIVLGQTLMKRNLWELWHIWPIYLWFVWLSGTMAPLCLEMHIQASSIFANMPTLLWYRNVYISLTYALMALFVTL